MIKQVLQRGVLALAAIVIAASYSHASPMAGDTITLGYGTYHQGVGGEFLLESATPGSDYSFVTFCLEKNEYFKPGNTYKVQNVDYYANRGGYGYTNDGYSTRSKDYISNTTKWLMNEYIFNYDAIWDGRDKNDFAGLMQNTVWFLENEVSSLDDSYLLTYYQDQMGDVYDLSYTPDYLDNIQVVNIVNGAGKLKQSQIIATAPVPEPATMLLFGSGLVGLAAIGRKKIRK